MDNKHFICRHCHFVGRAAIKMKGSKGMEKFLYWTLFIPGPFYSLWRHLSKYKVCPKCGSKDVIDIDSAEGRILFEKQMKKF